MFGFLLSLSLSPHTPPLHTHTQCSKELKVNGIIGPCISLNKRTQAVSDNVRPYIITLYLFIVHTGDWNGRDHCLESGRY